MSEDPAPHLSHRELVERLRLIRSENVGPVTFRHLVTQFGSAGAAIEALPELARRGGRKRPIKICAKAAAEREATSIAELGIQVLALDTPAYPPALAAVEDAPPLLFVRGHRHLLEHPTVALVGARNASANGRRLARDLARELAAQGYLVASGLARGIDTAAHEGALADGTAAVLAGGVDVIYPPENTDLYHEIAERGVLLAENPPGMTPQARHFPQRNRLISGLARGVVVVEAALRSGSLITARLAGEQGREVMAVPGSPADARAAGCNRLIKQGAALIETAADAQAVLSAARPPMAEEGPRAALRPSGPPSEEVVAEAREVVASLLAPNPTPVDEILRECHFSPAVVTTVLLELELAGRCERHPGNQVSLLT